MALIKCPECGHDVSDKATACPGCGFPMAAQDSRSSGQAHDSSEKRPPDSFSQEDLPRRFGKYELQSILGRGGMGNVYLALDTFLQRKVAIKILPMRLSYDETWVQRSHNEARQLAKLDHPNITVLHDAGEEEGYQYLAMEYIEGATLGRAIQDDDVPPLQVVLRIMAAVAGALQHAHENDVIHRDIKPDNVFIDLTGQAVLGDFGLAAPGSGDPLQAEGVIVGTPNYMSPEAAKGEVAGPQADIWSFGATMYHLFAGRLVYEGKAALDIVKKIASPEAVDLSPLGDQVPEYVASIIGRCLKKDPVDRYQTADEVRRDLEAAIDHIEISAAQTMAMPAPREGQTLLLHVEYEEADLPGSYRPYEVGSYVGSGTYGDVYRATEKLSGREMALKILKREWLSDDDTVRRFRREAAVLARLAHPNILRVHNFGRYGPTFFIAMDLLEGRTLDELVRDRSPMQVGEAVSYSRQILSGLAVLHESGVIHRDLKPANVMASDDRAVIVDFGMARAADMSRMTMSGMFLGTPAYASPEQALGTEVMAASDVYAAGVSLYEMLSGHLPHEADSSQRWLQSIATEPPTPIAEHRSDLPKAIAEVLERMLAKDPVVRPTAVEAGEMLASVLG